MKRFISIMLAAVMLILPAEVFADKDSAAKMQEALLMVKEKITVPAELSEVSGGTAGQENRMSYNFEWTTPDYEKSMSVSCDSEGRIISYYDRTFEMSEKKLSKVSKGEIIDYAENFLKKALPECFEKEDDKLVYDEDSYDARGNLRYNLEFIRMKDSVPVKDNYASVSLCVAENKVYVRSMNVSFNYDAEFKTPESELEDYVARYMQAFPAELVYSDEYNLYAKGDEPRNTPVLVYRIKDDDIGYIDISTGEIITEEPYYDELYRKEFSTMDSALNESAAGGGSSLTEQEIAELSIIEGLLGVGDIEEGLKKLPYLNFSDNLKIRSSDLYKDITGEYYYRLSYTSEHEKEYAYFNVRANAKSGEIISISNNSGVYDEKYQLTEQEIAAAEVKTEEFLRAVAEEKMDKVTAEDTEDYSYTVNSYYARMVNGIKYISNGIHVSFDAKNNVIRSYNLNFTDGEFADPKNAVGTDVAYEKILDYAPAEPIYIYSGGNYKKAVSLEKRGILLDAVKGEIKNAEIKNDYSYADINGHWSKEAAEKLAEIQIGIQGGALEPDRGITQEEFLRLLCTGMMNKYYAQYSQEELYNILIRDKVLKKEEKAPEALVNREDAFVTMIRLAGLEKVAKLEDIYKVSYADQHLLSEGKIGYAAILSGMKVICGDGGNLRPTDALTRAEAIVMLYRYLLTL